MTESEWSFDCHIPAGGKRSQIGTFQYVKKETLSCHQVHGTNAYKISIKMTIIFLSSSWFFPIIYIYRVFISVFYYYFFTFNKIDDDIMYKNIFSSAIPFLQTKNVRIFHHIGVLWAGNKCKTYFKDTFSRFFVRSLHFMPLWVKITLTSDELMHFWNFGLKCCDTTGDNGLK